MSDRNQIATLYILRKDIELPAKLADGAVGKGEQEEAMTTAKVRARGTAAREVRREGKCLNRPRLPVVLRLFGLVIHLRFQSHKFPKAFCTYFSVSHAHLVACLPR
jgi:hypothetical protein